MYDEEYFTKAKNSPYIGYPKSVNGLNLVENQMKERAELLIKKYGEEFSLVDWGCATGILVKMLRDKGVEAYGFDFAAWAIEHKVSNYVYLVDALALDEMSPVDVMHSSDFLEHLPADKVKDFLLNISKFCNIGMCHYIPFYPDYKEPVSSPGDIHLCEVNSDWWLNVFKSIPNFEIEDFPTDENGGYVVLKRVD